MTLRSAFVGTMATAVASLPDQVPDLSDMNTVRDIYLRFAITNYFAQMTTNYTPELNIAATMTVDGIDYAATGLALHESITFGPQQADVSTGRLYAGALPWVTFPTPTYLARNELGGCGQRTHGALTPSVHDVDMIASGTLQVSTNVLYSVASGPIGGIGVAALALGGDHLDLAPLGIGDEVLLLGLPSLVLPYNLFFDGAGATSWNFPVPAGVAGTRLYAQVFSLDAVGWDSSRVIEVTICP